MSRTTMSRTRTYAFWVSKGRQIFYQCERAAPESASAAAPPDANNVSHVLHGMYWDVKKGTVHWVLKRQVKFRHGKIEWYRCFPTTNNLSGHKKKTVCGLKFYKTAHPSVVHVFPMGMTVAEARCIHNCHFAEFISDDGRLVRDPRGKLTTA